MIQKVWAYSNEFTKLCSHDNDTLAPIGGFHVTSKPPCMLVEENKRFLVSSFCSSTSNCTLQHYYLCPLRLAANHLYSANIFLCCLYYHNFKANLEIPIQNEIPRWRTLTYGGILNHHCKIRLESLNLNTG